MLNNKKPYPDIYAIRLKNIRDLIGENKEVRFFADKVSFSPVYARAIMGKKPRRNVGSKTARKIEVAFLMPYGWLDNRHLFQSSLPLCLKRKVNLKKEN